MTHDAVLLLLVPAWPCLLALAALVLHQRHIGGVLAIAGPLPALAAGLHPAPPLDAAVGWLLLDTRLGLNAADSVFLAFTAVVWLTAGVFSLGWFEQGRGRRRFFALFLLTMTGNMGALVAQDLPGFYAAFALMSFAAYGLIAHAATREAIHAANVYIVLVVIGEAALFAAMAIAAGTLGATDFATVRAGLEAVPLRHLVVALAFLGFGIKAGLLVLHVWLPLAHPVAPAPASAVLSGTIIVTGLIGWLRFLPVGVLALPGWGGACIALGLAATFYGAIVGMDQRRPKIVLAYSSISQMGIMTVGLGMILLEPAMAAPQAMAIALFAAHHGLAKGALFLGAGLGGTEIGAAQRRRLLIGLALPSLALAGAPFTSGMVAKSALVAGEAALPEPWAQVTRVLLPLTSVATALLMARFLVLVRVPPAETAAAVGRGPWLTWAASVLLVLILPAWLALTPGTPTAHTDVLGSLWPLATALVVALVAVHAWRRAGRPRVPEIPAGDVLLPLEWLVSRAGNSAQSLTRWSREHRRRLQAAAAAGRHRAWAVIQGTKRVEAMLVRWRLGVTLALAIGTAVAWLAA